MALLRRLAPFGLLVLVFLAACGKGSASTPSVPKQPSDPLTAATATIPSALPAPIAAVPVAVATGAPGSGPGASAGASPTSGPNTYAVKSGDTLGGIASKLGVSLTALQSANPNVQAADLSIGQNLNVPAAPQAANPPSGASATPAAANGGAATPAAGATITTPAILPTRTPAAAATARAAASAASSSSTGPQTYSVKSGDTACKIATAHQVSLRELAEANGTSAAGLGALKIGQQLKIPAATGSLPGC